jgi:hypothetical protein
MCISTFHLLQLYLVITHCISLIFLHLLSTNHKCTQPCYFPPVIQTYCSEDAVEEFFDVEV